MNSIKRSAFLKMGSAFLVSPFLPGALNGFSKNGRALSEDTAMLKQLAAANDAQVRLLLESVREGNLEFSRKTAYDIAVLCASYCCTFSVYHQDPALLPRISLLVQFMADAQTDDGTVNVGNLESPPDTAFVMEILCGAAEILQKENRPGLDGIREKLKQVIVKAGDALAIGGVHTPNHRWVVSAALSQINALYPQKKYRDRINDWLDEGIYIDKDGHFPERSGTYSGVETTAFITLSRHLNKPELLEAVRKNLEMMFYYMEDNGDFVSNDSRRQDQYAARRITYFYLQYRYMAVHDNSPRFAAIAKKIELTDGFDRDILSRSLFYFLENETLRQVLPAPAALPRSYEKLFTTSHLLRIKREHTTMTLFGGVDWPVIIASGRSNSPDFFSYRKGEAILKYMRLSSGFFSMGYFYSEGLTKKDSSYILHKKLEVPYYQPLPENKRRKDGDYKLSPSIDDRFWNKMDFENRPVSNVKTLDTTVTFTESNGNAELQIEIAGMDNVPVTIEMCFKEGGELAGLNPDEKGNYFLEEGEGLYRYGKDTIKFGPGNRAFRKITNLEGERYSTHFGSLRTEGMHVYITGYTPFKHTLKLG